MTSPPPTERPNYASQNWDVDRCDMSAGISDCTAGPRFSTGYRNACPEEFHLGYRVPQDTPPPTMNFKAVTSETFISP